MNLKQQRGTVLIMSILMLTILLIGSAALIRSSGSNATIAGNIAFKQVATSVAGVGLEIASNILTNIADHEITVHNQYYAASQEVDENGLPSNVDWSEVPSTAVQNYNVQYVIERLCTGALPVNDATTQCNVGAISNTKIIGAPVYQEVTQYYRVTVRVTGPKSTNAFIQAIMYQS